MAINRKLGRRTDIRTQLVYSQASELLWNGKIETTVERAKEVRKVAEKMLTLAINTYEDTVTVTKQKLNQKDESALEEEKTENQEGKGPENQVRTEEKGKKL